MAASLAVLWLLVGLVPGVASAAQNFDQARAADVGVSENGTVRPTGFDQQGECIKSVQRWIAAAGGRMAGGGAYSAYINSPADLVATGASAVVSQAVKGDVIQYTYNPDRDAYANGVHTVMVVANNGNGTLRIVQSNAPAGSGRVSVIDNWRPAAPANFTPYLWRFGHITTTTANGSFLRAADTGRVYRVVGGAPLWLSTCVEGCPGLRDVTQAAINAMPAVPANGTFVRAAETGRVYRVAGGAPLWLSTCVDGCPGLVNVNQWTIDVLDHLHAVPDNGSFVRAAETGRVYRVAGGAPLWLSTCVDGCPDLVNVNQWTIDVLDHLHAVPDNGTLLLAIETGRVYQVTGGVPSWLSVCPPQGCAGAVRINQWTVDARDHLRT